jgi:hypothetical protein
MRGRARIISWLFVITLVASVACRAEQPRPLEWMSREPHVRRSRIAARATGMSIMMSCPQGTSSHHH